MWIDLFRCHYALKEYGYELISFPVGGQALDQCRLTMHIFGVIKDEEHRIRK